MNAERASERERALVVASPSPRRAGPTSRKTTADFSDTSARMLQNKAKFWHWKVV